MRNTNNDMRVNFAPYRLTFTSNSAPQLPPEGIRMGYDGVDEYFPAHKFVRNSLNEHSTLLYQQFYGAQKTEEEMNRMLESWGLRPDKFSGKIVVPEYLNTESIGNNNFKGVIPWHESTFKTLKESGIECIIDLIGSANIEKAVRNSGLEYFGFPIGKDGRSGFWNKPAFLNDEELKSSIFRDNSRDFIDNFIKFVRRLDAGRCFIGCEFGTADTNDALRLYKTFSSEKVQIRLPFINFDQRHKFEKIQNLFDKLTLADKKALNWSDELIKLYDHSNILRRLHR